MLNCNVRSFSNFCWTPSLMLSLSRIGLSWNQIQITECEFISLRLCLLLQHPPVPCVHAAAIVEVTSDLGLGMDSA